MDWKLGGIVLTAALASAPVMADGCDWKVTKEVDPMTDVARCIVTSESAKIGLSVDSKEVVILNLSAYRRAGTEQLRIRVDENPAVAIHPRGKSTGSFEESARTALRQIIVGNRIRTAYRDYPNDQSGDAQICTLPEILKECGAPLERLKDTRTQSDILTNGRVK